jgi:hypothetical protein
MAVTRSSFIMILDLLHEDYRQNEIPKPEEISDDEEQDDEYRVDEEYIMGEEHGTDEDSIDHSAVFSKTLAILDKTENTKALRLAANTFTKILNRSPFLEEEQSGQLEKDISAKAHHSFITDNGSPWNKAVESVVDSAHAMSEYATSACAYPNAVTSGRTSPPPPPSQSLPSYLANQTSSFNHHHHIGAVQASVSDTVQTQVSTNNDTTTRSKAKKNCQPSPGVASFHAFSAKFRGSPSAVSPVTPSFIQLDGEHYLPPANASEQAPQQEPAQAVRVETPIQAAQVSKERMLTIHPLLLPPENKFILAHRLASLYFAAVLDPWDVPEFKAKYIYTDGRCSSILLTLKSAYDSDSLKELWDATDRANTRAPELANVLLYLGNTSAYSVDISVRNAAVEELASYMLMPCAMF